MKPTRTGHVDTTMSTNINETELDNLDKLHEAQPEWPMPEWYIPKANRVQQENREYADLNKALETVNKLIVMERRNRQ